MSEYIILLPIHMDLSLHTFRQGKTNITPNTLPLEKSLLLIIGNESATDSITRNLPTYPSTSDEPVIMVNLESTPAQFTVMLLPLV